MHDHFLWDFTHETLTSHELAIEAILNGLITILELFTESVSGTTIVVPI